MEAILEYTQDPVAIAIFSAVVIALWLLFAPQYSPKRDKNLSTAQKEERLASWRPKPIVPTTYNPQIQQIAEPLVVHSDTGAIITTQDGQEYLNFSSGNYLGLASLPEVKEEAKAIIREYGVGSCGPRGFYGTIDLHLQLESTFANFMSTNDAILYSDGMACLSSVIPAFSKAGDYIIVDSQANCAIQQGLKLSRSKIVKFDHNNMESLEQMLKQNDDAMAPHDKVKYRRFVVVEGIYAKTGSVCNVKKVAELARKYKFRVILDDSNAVGVLGKTGRGSMEHWGLTLQDVQIVCATLDNSLSSVGGLCIGSKQIVSHQRLSGAGYCFSAASPPYTARIATYALGLIHTNPQLLEILQKKCSFAYQTFTTQLSGQGMDVLGDAASPIIVLRPSSTHYNKWLATNDTSMATTQYSGVKVPGAQVEIYEKLKQIVAKLRSKHHIVVSAQHHAPQEDLYAFGIKIQITTLHSNDDIQLCASLIKNLTLEILDSVIINNDTHCKVFD